MTATRGTEGVWCSALLAALDQISADHSATMELLRPGLQDGFPWHDVATPHAHLHTPELWWNEMRALPARLRRRKVSEPVAEQAAAAVGAIHLDERYWTVFDDVRSALQRLRATGYRNVRLSNHVPELAELVDRLGIADLVDNVLPHRSLDTRSLTWRRSRMLTISGSGTVTYTGDPKSSSRSAGPAR